jgi:beta-mannosidase
MITKRLLQNNFCEGIVMNKISLDGIWQLFYFSQGQYEIKHPDQLDNGALTPIPASVPGNVELDLSRAGILPEDLFFGENIHLLKPYELYEWWYVTEFDTQPGIGSRDVELVFCGVDCLAEYWLNGEKIGSTENMLIEHHFRVAGRLVTHAANKLAIRLRSPIREAMEKEYDPLLTYVWGGPTVENAWIRKAPHGYGWDIMPRAVTAGLWRSVELVIHEDVEISDLFFMTLYANSDKANLQVHFDLKINPELLHQELYLSISGCCGDSSFSTRSRVKFKAGTVEVSIQNPRLWWPKGYGNADLYEVVTRLECKAEVLAVRTDRIGVRTIELIRTEATGNENPGQFLFKVNGTPILCKGSNWVPADAFHSRDAGRYEKILALFDDLGCNILRCWGGNVYEDHAFYNICDSSGIMVWQDFAMACAVNPQTPDFQEILRKEATAVVRKLRNHPSITLWSGDNEVDALLLGRGIDPGQNKLTREVLPAVVFQCDPCRPFLPSSPYVSKEFFSSRNTKSMPEDHLWGPRDYYKSRFYTGSNAHFVSEIGYHGCPNLSSIQRFIDTEHIWPGQNNKQWITHSTDHAENPARTKLMADQVQEMFGEIPENIGEFIMASQISQAEAKKFFVEMTRLRKWKRTGVIWWNVMDGWPQFSDAIVDYYFGKKLAYYYIKRVQKPVCIMLDEPEGWHLNAVVGNDSREDALGQYRIWDADTGESLLEGDFYIKANENRELGKIRVSHSDHRLFLMEWFINGKKYANHYMLGFPPVALDRYKGWLLQIAALHDGFEAEAIGR